MRGPPEDRGPTRGVRVARTGPRTPARRGPCIPGWGVPNAGGSQPGSSRVSDVDVDVGVVDHPAPGFDLVNSPGQLRSVDLGRRTVVQKTTAGTVGALAAKEASLVLCASFVVAEATARLLRTRKSDSITFVVTGDDGQAGEDLACAQYIARRATEAETDAAGSLRRAAASRAAADQADGVRQGVHPDDVALCLELDRFPFPMTAALEDSLMVLRPYAVPSPAVGGAGCGS